MSTIKNKVQLIGHLGADPEIVDLKEGRKLAKFSVATNETYKNNEGERVTETQWHNLVAWGKLCLAFDSWVGKVKKGRSHPRPNTHAY